MTPEHFDVLIVGAGLSGVGAGYHVQTECPGKSYAILEARDTIGGTWDLFRYPGIRSDSDMFTLGYSFRPWREAKSIADGPSILSYIRQTAQDYGIDRKIRFNHRVTRVSWSTTDATWTVEAERGPARDPVRFTCGFLYMCSGYYNYAEGYTPQFAGRERFRGRIVHPQKWTDDVDYAGKRVVVIGSGATAVTLVPAMAEKAAHVTMVQRSPSYIMSLPANDAIARFLGHFLPRKWVYPIVRWKQVLLAMFFFQLSRRRPELMKKLLRRAVRAELPAGFDVDTHFKPRYNPWDQRVCFVPDADLFKALRENRASIVTGQIDTFTETGVRLESGAELPADLIVTATGLNMMVLGGAKMAVGGQEIENSRGMVYKGMMLRDVPNFAFATGYTNASWTLKCDLTSAYVCRLLNHMDRHGYRTCTPRNNDPTLPEEPLIDFSSGYVQRALPSLPKQGSRRPWKLFQNYALDLFTLKLGAVDDGVMEFANGVPATSAAIASPVERRAA